MSKVDSLIRSLIPSLILVRSEKATLATLGHGINSGSLIVTYVILRDSEPSKFQKNASGISYLNLGCDEMIAREIVSTDFPNITRNGLGATVPISTVNKNTCKYLHA